MRYLMRNAILLALTAVAFVGYCAADLKFKGIEKPRRSNVFIISVGINKYADPAISSLRFAVADAEALATQMEARNSSSGFGVAQGEPGSVTLKSGSEPPVVRILLRNNEATRERIGEAFNEVARQITPNDIFFFSYSGMGWHFNGEFALFTQSSSYVDGGKSAKGVLTTAELQALFRKIRAKNKLLLLDSCDSADGYDALASAFIESDGEMRAAIADNVLFIGTDGLSYETPELEHGTLTKVVLEGLEGAADFDGNGVISASELEAFVYCGSVKYKKYHTSPRTIRSGGDFNIAFSDKKQKDLAKTPVRSTPAAELKKDEVTRAEPFESTPGAPAPTTRNGDDYALLFANSYTDDPNWPALKNPINDVNDIAAELRNRYGFKEVVVKENLTSRQIRETLTAYQSRNFTRPDDQLFIFFAGHGVTERISDIASNSYYVGSGAPKFTIENSGHFMQLDSVLTMIAGLKINHVMTVFDACFAGQIWRPAVATYSRRASVNPGVPWQLQYASLHKAGRRIGKSASSIFELESLVDERLIFAKRTMADQSRIVLTSGNRPVLDAYRRSDGSLSRNSPFAEKMLEALREGGRNYNVLTAKEIYTAVQGLPVQPMVGEMGGSNGDFVFIGK